MRKQLVRRRIPVVLSRETCQYLIVRTFFLGPFHSCFLLFLDATVVNTLNNREKGDGMPFVINSPLFLSPLLRTCGCLRLPLLCEDLKVGSRYVCLYKKCISRWAFPTYMPTSFLAIMTVVDNVNPVSFLGRKEKSFLWRAFLIFLPTGHSVIKHCQAGENLLLPP